MKTIYTCFSTDYIHEGHLKIISEAQKYGRVIVGVLSDEAKVRFDRFPYLSFDERFNMVKKLDGIDGVVIQHEVMYDKILNELRPDYVIHGDNWNIYPYSAVRDNVMKNLSRLGGELVEVPYTRTEKVLNTDSIAKERLAMPEFRRKRLRMLLKLRELVKAIEVHSGMSGLIA